MSTSIRINDDSTGEVEALAKARGIEPKEAADLLIRVGASRLRALGKYAARDGEPAPKKAKKGKKKAEKAAAPKKAKKGKKGAEKAAAAAPKKSKGEKKAKKAKKPKEAAGEAAPDAGGDEVLSL